MRILIVNQFFWPDVAPTGQYLCDLVRHLSANGHEITVICSSGSYAQAEDNDEDPPPVKIIRVPGMAYKRGALARLFSYSTFFTGALWHELRVPRPDMVVTMTTPPLLAVVGTIMKALRGTRHYIWEMDVFPDLLVTLGALSERGLLTRILAWIQKVRPTPIGWDHRPGPLHADASVGMWNTSTPGASRGELVGWYSHFSRAEPALRSIASLLFRKSGSGPRHPNHCRCHALFSERPAICIYVRGRRRGTQTAGASLRKRGH